MDQLTEGIIILLKQWWFWLGSIVFIILGNYLFGQRAYKEQNGKLLVRHGKFGKWAEVTEHLRHDHTDD